MNTAGLVTPPPSPFNVFEILSNGVSHDPIEARLPWYLPFSRMIRGSPTADPSLAARTNHPPRAKTVDRQSTHDVGGMALTCARVQQLETSLASSEGYKGPVLVPSPIDSAWLAERPRRRRGRRETTSEEDVARAAKICRLEEVRCARVGGELSDAEMYKIWYRSLQDG